MISGDQSPFGPELEDALAALDDAMLAGEPTGDLERRVAQMSGADAESLFSTLKVLHSLPNQCCNGSPRKTTVDTIVWTPNLFTAKLDGYPSRLGRFEILERIGAGGSGLVFLARDPQIGRQVALKIPRAETLFSAEARKRFFREAELVAALKHPNIVPVFEAGEADGIPYIVEEYSPGQNLAEWLRSRNDAGMRASCSDAARWMAQLADALARVHSCGIVHRDLKPANVLMEPQAIIPPGKIDIEAFEQLVPRITDFGIAKLFTAQETLTASYALLGTAAYMAPEQARGEARDVGPAADVYSLGVICYEMLAGQRPFPTENPIQLLRHIAEDEPLQVNRIRGNIPKDLASICMKCLEKNPAHRYANAADLRDDLQRYLGGYPVSARPLRRAARVLRRLRGRVFSFRFVLSAAIVGATLLGAIGWISWNSSHKHDQAAKRQHEQSRAAVAVAYPDEIRRVGMLLKDDAWFGVNREQDIEGARRILDSYVPRDGEPDLRGFEWYYFQRLLHPAKFAPRFKQLREVSAHEGAAYSVSFSRDGSRLATAGADGKARVWDAASGKLLQTLGGHEGEVDQVDWSPDGKSLATAGEDGKLRLWDAASGTLRQVLWDHTVAVECICFSPNGTQIAAGAIDGVIYVYSFSAEIEPLTIPAHAGKRVQAIAYSPDGTLLASVGDDNALKFWDVAKSFQSLLTHSAINADTSLAFSPNGQFVACAGPYETHVVKAGTGEYRARLGGVRPRIRAAVFLPDELTIATVGDDLATGLQDLVTREVWNPFGDIGHCWCVACSADGQRMATTDAKGVLRIWDSSSWLSLRRATLSRSDAIPLYATMDAEGRRVAFATVDVAYAHPLLKREVAVWDISKSTPTRVLDVPLKHEDGEICALSLSPDGRELVASILDMNNGYHPALRFLDSSTGIEKRRAESPKLQQWISHSPDGSVLLALAGVGGSSNWNLEFWDPRTARLISQVPYDWLRAVALSPDGETVAVRGTQPEIVDVYRILDQQKLATWNAGEDVDCLQFSHDGRQLVTGNQAGSFSVLDSQSGAIRRRFNLSDANNFYAFALSPDNRTLALGVNDGVLLVNFESGTPMCTLVLLHETSGDGCRVQWLKFSNDGRSLLAVAAGKTKNVSYLWQLDTAESPKILATSDDDPLPEHR